MNLRCELERRLIAALAEAGAPAETPALVAPSARDKFGDYQANGVMAAAKELKTNPRELAGKVVAAADLSGMAEMEVAGPGFINITLKADWLVRQLSQAFGERRGVAGPGEKQQIVVDYSAPNIAKEMYVGHLRSTIIGDAMVRVLEYLGHDVIRQNHVGDWGRQFGKVILGMWHLCMAEKRHDPEYILRSLEKLSGVSEQDKPDKRRDVLIPIWEQHQQDLDSDRDGEKTFHPYLKEVIRNRSLTLIDLLPAYQFVNRVESLAKGTDLIIKSPPDSRPKELAKVSSYITWMLQKYCRQDQKNRQEYDTWKLAKELTLDACDDLYKRLGVTLARDDVRGESAYNNDLPNVVKALKDKGLLRESDGAQCVFLPEFTGKDGAPLPVIVQKSDGGYLYATTDLAAIRYRVSELHARRILYVTDSRQALHFRQIFAVARKAGFAPADVLLEHVAFGMMLGADRRPFRTRDGGTVKLMDLLDEAVSRAYALVDRKNPDLPDERKRDIARKVGIGAVKYADLSQNRTSDYVFSWDKMLSLDGNTAPYMQYAYARIQSIFRKSAGSDPGGAEIIVADPAERALAVKLLQFAETVDAVAGECLPNVLCSYLYDLAGAFTGFYENCPVLKSDEPIRSSRLALCELTAGVIRTGLELLGIETIEQM